MKSAQIKHINCTKIPVYALFLFLMPLITSAIYVHLPTTPISSIPPHIRALLLRYLFDIVHLLASSYLNIIISLSCVVIPYVFDLVHLLPKDYIIFFF